MAAGEAWPLVLSSQAFPGVIWTPKINKNIQRWQTGMPAFCGITLSFIVSGCRAMGPPESPRTIYQRSRRQTALLAPDHGEGCLCSFRGDTERHDGQALGAAPESGDVTKHKELTPRQACVLRLRLLKLYRNPIGPVMLPIPLYERDIREPRGLVTSLRSHSW